MNEKDKNHKILIEVFKGDLERESFFIEKCNDHSENKHFTSGLRNIKATAGLYRLAVEKDFQKAKQCFYLCGKIDEYTIKMYGSQLLGASMRNLTFTVLSDNIDIIKRYGKLTYTDNDYWVKKGNIFYAAQCIINDDIESLKEQVNKLKKKIVIPKNHWNIPDHMFYEGYLAGDMQKMEEAIALLLTKKHHEYRNQNALYEKDIISVPATLYAKLAWLKGFEVKVDSPLIPQELLPHKPNEHYENSYDFLNELDGEKPLPKKQITIVPFDYIERPKPKPSNIISYETTRLTVEESGKNRNNWSEEEIKELTDKIWLAYSDPKAFDVKYKDYILEKGFAIERIIDSFHENHYEFPMLMEWTLNPNELNHYVNMIMNILSEEIDLTDEVEYGEVVDWFAATTLGKTLDEQNRKEQEKKPSLADKLKKLWSKN